MCSVGIECVLQVQNVFCRYRMCSVDIECVLQVQTVFCRYNCAMKTSDGVKPVVEFDNQCRYRMCSVGIEYVL